MSAADAVARVARRCEEASETETLDLQLCKLTQVPDAIFMLLRTTSLMTCVLSHNNLRKLPPKLARRFAQLEELDVSHNRLSALPDEFSKLTSLQRLNLSHNRFVRMPSPVYCLTKLTRLQAQHNLMSDIDVDRMNRLQMLTKLNVDSNAFSVDKIALLKNRFQSE